MKQLLKSKIQKIKEPNVFLSLVFVFSLFMILSFRSNAADVGLYDYLTNNTKYKEMYTAAYNMAPDKTGLFAPEEIFGFLGSNSQYQYIFLYRYFGFDHSIGLYVARADITLDNGLNKFSINSSSDYLNGTYEMCYVNFTTNENMDVISYIEGGESHRTGPILFTTWSDIYEHNNSNFNYMGFNSTLNLYKDPDLYITATTFSPSGHSTGRVVVPEFPEPDPDDKTQTINIIGWKGLFENFEKFFKPYLDHTFDILDTIVGFPDNDFILDQYHNSYLYTNLVAPVNLITQSVVGLFNAPDVQGHGTPRFELDFSNVVGFESVGKVYLDFNWYVPFKSQINAVIIALVVLGFIVYLIKEIPNLIAGRSDKID